MGGYPASVRPRLSTVLAVLLLVTPAPGCATIPRDPEGTLERVRTTRLLRVGASPSEGRVVVAGTEPAGPEVELVTGFAEAVGARVDWRVGGEEELVGAMERGELDLLAGGLSDRTPWSQRVSVTRPYAESRRHGEPVKHVLAVPLGENAMLGRLERYLDEAGR